MFDTAVFACSARSIVEDCRRFATSSRARSLTAVLSRSFVELADSCTIRVGVVDAAVVMHLKRTVVDINWELATW